MKYLLLLLIMCCLLFSIAQSEHGGYENVVINPTDTNSCGVTGDGDTTAGATETNTGPACTGESICYQR